MRLSCFKIWSPNPPSLARPLPRANHLYFTLARTSTVGPALQGQGTHAHVRRVKWNSVSVTAEDGKTGIEERDMRLSQLYTETQIYVSCRMHFSSFWLKLWGRIVKSKPQKPHKSSSECCFQGPTVFRDISLPSTTASFMIGRCFRGGEQQSPSYSFHIWVTHPHRSISTGWLPLRYPRDVTLSDSIKGAELWSVFARERQNAGHRRTQSWEISRWHTLLWIGTKAGVRRGSSTLWQVRSLR